MRLLLLLNLFFCLFRCAGQVTENEIIEIRLINDSLRTFMDQSELTVSIQTESKTEKALLLYGFGNNIIRPWKKTSEFCDLNRLGAGIALFVYDSANKNRFATIYIPKELKYKPMPKDTLESRNADLNTEYLKGTKVVQGFDSDFSDVKIDLKDFDLERGMYHLQIIYYSGRILEKAVGRSQIEKDRKNYNAELYQGCAISNKIIFRID
jgi:hypothetical protein